MRPRPAAAWSARRSVLALAERAFAALARPARRIVLRLRRRSVARTLTEPFAPEDAAEEALRALDGALDGDRAPALRVLFIGNSFTLAGPLPLVLGKLLRAGAPARAVKVRMVAVAHAKLEDHARGDAARAIANEGPWDHVVLQDHSRMALNAPDAMRASVQRLDELARTAGARTLLYMTWASAHEGRHELELIARAYEQLGKEIDAPVAAVGRAWLAAGPLRRKLYGPDGHHPSALGVYLSACVLYGGLVGETPVGLPYVSGGESPSRDEVAELQRLAARYSV